jgi:hypothetical protein
MATSGNPLAPNPETNIDNPGLPNPPLAPEPLREDPGQRVPIGEPDEGEDASEKKHPDDGPM